MTKPRRHEGAEGPYRLGLLGHPLGHSLSPVIHGAALEALGVDGAYALHDVEEAALAGFVARVRAGELDGINVTIPYKLAVAGLCDRLEGAGAALGAVNTLARAADGAVVGHNTDVGGLARAVREALGDVARGGVVAVVGAGGAGYAAVLAASSLGARRVRVWNRTRERAEALVARLGAVVSTPLEVADNAARAADAATLLLQATSVGLSVAPSDAAWPGEVAAAAEVVAAMAADGAVYDLVYRPARTVWCAAAEASGRRAVSGLGMLVHQAADAFALWTGHEPPRDVMRAAAEAALGAR